MILLNDEYLAKEFHNTIASFPKIRKKLPKNLSVFRTSYIDLLRNERNILDDWLKASNWAEKTEKAAEIVPKLLMALLYYILPQWAFSYLYDIQYVSQGVFTVPVSARLESIGREIPKFERWLTITKVDIGEKFYRDHINHVLRVMLLSSYLASEIRRQIMRLPAYKGLFYYFSTDKNEFERKIWFPLVLSSLYHDLAYPISETYQTHKDLETALDKCYQVHKYLQDPERYRIDEILSSLRKNALLNRDHGIWGAMDFLLLFDKLIGHDKNLDDLLLTIEQAIVLHNKLNRKNTGIKFDKYPVAFLLILCDELQDWGRPIGENIPPILDSIGLDVSIDGKGRILIKTDLDFSHACEGFSSFLQYKSKVNSLKRLLIDPQALEGPYLDITLHIPKYEKKERHPHILANEKTKEFYEIKGPKFEADVEDETQYFDELQNTGLRITTCGCGHIIDNVEVEPKPYLFNVLLEEFRFYPFESVVSPREKEPQKWTLIPSIKPNRYCPRCNRRYGDLE